MIDVRDRELKSSHGVFRRLTALVLSWVMPATTVWAAAPPAVAAVPSAVARVGASASASHVRPATLGAPVPAALSSAVLPLLTGGGGDTAAVRPIFECVTEQGAGAYTAYFGYQNDNANAVTINVGSNNKFSPNPQDRGQPKTFQPGRTPFYPNAAFGVAFNGSSLTWTLKGPDGQTRTVSASSSSLRCTPPPPPPPPANCAVTIFGPKRYTRTSGSPDHYTDTFALPPAARAPFTLNVRNGEANGSHRISSAIVELNDVEILRQSDFNQNVATLERGVNLASSNRLEVELRSAPDSYLTITVCGSSGDTTAPVLTIAAPPALTRDNTPDLLVRYSDPGAGASGVDTATLQVFLDDVDRTALFTKQSGEANATVPASLALADGVHRLRATIRDRSGNQGQATAEFRVDASAPQVQTTAPANGAYLASSSALARVAYADGGAAGSGLDLVTLVVMVNGQDRSALFAKTASEATAQLTLPSGPNTITATIKDLAGNQGSGTTAFVVDVVKPTVTIGQPAEGARLGTATPEVIVQYADDQGLALASFVAKIDGTVVALGQGPDGAMGVVGPLADGAHVFTASIADRAGNAAAATRNFFVDATLPNIRILQPPPGLVTREASPQILVTYDDGQGVDLAALKISVNGADRTAGFTVGPDSAAANLPDLVEGRNDVAAEIQDQAHNRGTASSWFTRDTIAPQAALVAPAPGSLGSSPTPAIQVSFSDGGTGIDPGFTRIFIDGTDSTPRFALGASGATGAASAPLADGTHSVRVVVQDRAGNATDVTGSFVVDTQAPTLAFTAPLAFTNDATPDVRLAYADPGASASGVASATLRVFLRSGSAPDEVEITSLFTPSADSATGTIATVLADGTHHLRAVVRDAAGNETAAEAGFDVDTVPPTYLVEQPADRDVVATQTPSFVIRYADDRSGVDTGLVALAVDATDRGARLVAGASAATATLLPEDALAEGSHTVAVGVRDRAGNAAISAFTTFVVDTIPPTATLSAPADGAYLGQASVAVQATFGDTSVAGIASVKLLVDGTDRTADVGATATSLQGTLALGDGAHLIRLEVQDWAAHVTAATASVTVDTLAPAVSIEAPGQGAIVGQSPVEVTGTVADADPQLAATAEGGAGGVSCTVASGAFTCAVPLAEGSNALTVTASDRFGRAATSAPRTVVLDTGAPQVVIDRPTNGEYVTSTSVEIAGHVTDATPVGVTVNGTAAVVDGGGAFTATISAGNGPDVSVTAVATDAAGHSAQASVTLHVDRSAPVVAISSPSEDAYLRGPVVDVAGTATDASAVMVDVNGQQADVSGSAFTARVPALDGPFAIVATARDAASNTASARRNVTIDSVAPAIAVDEPAEGLVTRASSLTIAGSITDATPVSATLDGAALALAGGSFSRAVSLVAEGARTFPIAASDAAGNASTHAVTILVDRSAPALQVGGPANGAVFMSLPVVVSGTVADASNATVTVNGESAVRTGSAWQATLGGFAEGAQTLTIVATDAAGNSVTVTRDIVLTLTAPTIAITSPASGTLTRQSTAPVTGTVTSRSTVSVAVGGTAATVTPSGADAYTFTATVALDEGDNHLVATATDGVGRSVDAELVVTRDSVAPLVDLSAPERVARGQQADAVASVTDAVGVATVDLQAAVTAACAAGSAHLTAPPYVLALVVPDCAEGGDTITVTLTATDRAGNTATASRGVRVAANGVIVGQVLDDTSSLPIAGATAVLVGPGAVATTTDATGRYTLPVADAQAIVTIATAGMTPADREISVESGVGNVPVDARLTPLAEPKAATDGAVVAGPVTLALSDGSHQLTLLSAQGLPGLLPLGWSPLAAFDWRGEGANVPATIGGLPASATSVHLVQYNATLHAWTLVSAALPVVVGSVSATLPGAGAFAVTVADVQDPALAIPNPGGVLAGAEMVALPATAASSGRVSPAVIAPTGGTAAGALSVTSPAALPSGTVVQAEIRETYTLADGRVASEETRREDVLLYRNPPAEGATGVSANTLAATFPVTPKRTFETAELTSGIVHLDILAGREAVRGKTGGSAPVVVEDGAARLSVPASALGEDTAISVKVEEPSSFLPQSLTAIGEMVVDLSGRSLGLSAELSFQTALGNPGDSYVLAKIERVDGVPVVVVAALASLSGDRLVSQPYPGLAGVTSEGRYVFFRTAGALGFVAGTTTTTAGAVKAIVTTDLAPFVGIGTPAGHFMVGSHPGTAALTATVPGTTVTGTASTTVTAGETASADIALSGTVTTATVTPADGAQGQNVNLQLEIETTAPLKADSVTPANVKLFKVATPGESEVGVRLVLSGSRKVLAVVPQQALQYATGYRLQVSGLADVYGASVSVPGVAFTTKPFTAPQYDTAKVVFSVPDAQGLVHVTAPAGTLAPGSEILIINSGNGFVATFTAENDGALGVLIPATFPASINDSLLITITDPLGNVTTFTRSQFENPATGETAIGPGGGVVKAADGSGAELRIPEGALDQGVTLKITSFALADLPADQRQAPDLGQTQFGHGLKIESNDKPTFKKEVKLAFPLPAGLPANPSDAFFYVVRKSLGNDGKVAFETLDQASVEGSGADARVVTASPPFSGYLDSFASFDISPVGSFAFQPTIAAYAYLMWSYDQINPARPIVGVITGKVLRAQQNPDGSQTLVGIKDALVAACDQAGHPLLVRAADAAHPNVAHSQGDGSFALWDASYAGGTVQVTAAIANADLHQGCQPASSDPRIKTATAYEVDPRDSTTPPTLASYKNVARVNVVFDPEAGPPPPASIDIQVMKLENGQRIATSGIVTQGTHLVLVLTAQNADVRSATLNGAACVVTNEGSFTASVDLETDPACHVGNPGTYTVTARALTLSLEVRDAAKSFLVVAPGGNNSQPIAGPPAVVSISPKSNATGVPVTVFPQVVFSEPVRLSGHVLVREALTSAAVPTTLLAVTQAGDVIDLAENPAVPVTSLTIQPTSGLKYSLKYEIVFEEGILDLDTPAGTLASQVSSFTTFGPESVGGSEEHFGSPGIYLFGDRAYLAQNGFYNGTVRVFDISDPVQPTEIEQNPQAIFAGRPVDLAGEEGTLVVATSSTNQSKPSNLLIFDIGSRTATNWVGAASVTRSTVEGYITRVQVKGDKAYLATAKKGIQVVDLARARANFDQTAPLYSAAYWRMVRDLGTDNAGFGPDAVEQETPVMTAAGRSAYLQDLKLIDIGQDPHRYALATGDLPFVALDTNLGALYPQTSGSGMEIVKGDASLTYGYALAAGTLENKPTAVVVGTGRTTAAAQPGFVLSTIDLSDPTNPAVLAIVDLPASETGGLSVTDALLNGDSALIGLQSSDQSAGKVLSFSLANLSAPIFTGILQGVGGRLALSENNILFSTWRSVFGGSNELGGVRTATLGKITIISGVQEDPVLVAQDRKTIEPQVIRYQVIPGSEEIRSSELEILRDGTVVRTIQAPLTDGKGETTLAEGTSYPSGAVLKTRLVVNRDDAQKPVPTERALRAEAFRVLPEGPVTVPALLEEEPLDLLGINQAILKRLGEPRDPRFQAPTLSWGVIDASGSTIPTNDTPRTGIYAGYLVPPTTAGLVARVELRKGGVVLGRTSPITIVPGPVSQDAPQISADRPPLSSGLPGSLPADGKTVVNITLSNIRDGFGNVLPDGTPVSWSIVEGDGGEIVAPVTPVQAGRSTTQYQAGTEPGVVTVRASIDDKNFEYPVIQKKLTVTVTDMGGGLLEAEVTSEAGPAAEGAPIFWGTSRGRVLGEGFLIGGKARVAYFEPPHRPGAPVFRNAHVFATVGRGRGDIHFPWDRPVPPGRLRISLNDERIIGDRTDGVSVSSGAATLSVPSRTVATLQGQPGQTVQVVLGSTRYPNVQPVAAYALDLIEETSVNGVVEKTASDPMGALPATVGAGVSVDTSQADHEPGVYHFTGEGGLTVPDAPALHLRENFGFNGFVRFDSLSAGQKVLEKAGAYALQVVELAGEPRLEFSVVSGGERKHVLSKQALAAATWYRFSAHFQSGQLKLALGDDDLVALGDASGPADPSEAALQIAPNLQGHLDEVAFYDLVQPPLLVFANQTPAITVTLDDQGAGSVEVLSAGLLAAPAGNDPFSEALRTGVIREYVAPEQQAGLEYELPGAFIAQALGLSTKECLEGILVGETQEWGGSGCDFFAGFLPVVGGYQTLRDAVKTVRHFAQGKQTAGDYVMAGFLVVTAAIAVLPAVRPLIQSAKRARAAAAGTRMEKVLADDILRAVGEHAADPNVIPDQALIRILGAETETAAKTALRDLLPRFRGHKGTWIALENLGKIHGHEQLVITLSRLANDARFTDDVVERVIHALRKAELPKAVSSDAIEGLAVFLKNSKAVPRVPRMWAEIRAASSLANDTERVAVMDRIFTLVKQGDLAVPKPAGWDSFIKGAVGGGLKEGPTAGFYHHLEGLASHNFQGIESIDQAVSGYAGRPDLILRDPATGLRIQEEYKNLARGESLHRRDIDQLGRNIREAVERAKTTADRVGRPVLASDITDELERIRYFFPGAEGAYHLRLRQDMIELIALDLEPQFKQLASRVKIVFQNKPRIPF